jgi:ABC-type dipeptide/oligopeptide/nickel transport system permease component
MLAIIISVVNFGTDVLVGLLDPRVRRA